MPSSSRRPAAAGALLALTCLLLVAPAPPAALRQLPAASSAADPTAPLVAAVALLAWLLSAWLLLTALLTLLSRVPGGTGRAASAAVHRVAPAAVRRLVALGLGAAVAAGTVTASPAAAAPGGGDPAGGGALEQPAGPAAPDLDWPTPPTSRSAAAASTAGSAVLGSPSRTGAATDVVVVRAGDTLWALAARALAANQTAAPSDRQVARAWPAWWSANRAVVGDDPDLLLPGTALQPPTGLSPDPS